MPEAASTAPQLPSSIAPGALVSGKYRVEKVLGQGAMGVVLAAKHEALDQRVAIKVVSAEGVAPDEALARFLREARIIAGLESEHVVRVMDVGALDDGSPYMVMEMLRGLDLGQVIERQGPLSVSEAADDMLEAMDAIAEAHARGIVHRDIKPSNLFRAQRSDGSSRIKVLDFGISKMAIDELAAVSLTKTHSMLGSPLYMSPEQILATKTVDARADIWSLGVVMFELLAGEPPFTGETMGAVLAQVLSSPIPRVRSKRPSVPQEIDDAIARCLEREVEKRWPSLDELAEQLAPFASTASAALVDRIHRLVAVPGRPSLPSSIPGRRSLPGPASATVRAETIPTVLMPANESETLVMAPRSVALRELPPVVMASSPPPSAPRFSRAVTLVVAVALALGIGIGWLARGAREASLPHDRALH